MIGQLSRIRVCYNAVLLRTTTNQKRKKKQHTHIMKKRGKKPEQAIKSDETHLSILPLCVQAANDVYAFILLFFFISNRFHLLYFFKRGFGSLFFILFHSIFIFFFFLFIFLVSRYRGK